MTLFHSWRQLHLQDRVQTNKVFHTRLVLTVHWLFHRSIIGILSATYRGKIWRSLSEMFKAKRPEGQITASYFQNLHYIKVNQAQRENCVFLCFAQTGVGEVDVSPPNTFKLEKLRSLLHGAAPWQKAVIYHNYASGPISSDPLAVILECAVVLSAFNAEREQSLDVMGCACQEL